MRLRGLLLLVLFTCGCGPAAATPFPATFDDFASNACVAFQGLFRAIGNPDAGTESELYAALNEAVGRRDPAAAGRVAEQIAAELQRSREAASRAAAWAPASAMMRELDEVLGAFEALVAAKQALASDPAATDPQAAFEAAGGATSWTAMLQQAQVALKARPPGEPPRECEGVPISF